MPNNISLTIRLPKELSNQLKVASKKVGMTKTNLIRICIHDFLVDNAVALDFSKDFSGEKDRIVFNVNQITYDILENACNQYQQSMNAVVTAVSFLALERASRWLKSIEN